MTIFCIEQNYFARKLDTSIKISEEPLIFLKTQDALWQQHSTFNLPSIAGEFHGACELVLRISKDGKDISEEFATDHYDAVTVGINFVAIDEDNAMAKAPENWNKANAWKNSSVIGNWISISEVKDKRYIDFCLYQNRQLLQMGNSEFMINGLDKIVAMISKKFSLKAGDIIFAGCPSPGSEIVSGDKLEAFINDDSLLEFDVE
jgi:2-keto-4-pentenoate hydratase/2-oxohepta-3-ene-1,7-dioic acid hydratase in catechol pathway